MVRTTLRTRRRSSRPDPRRGDAPPAPPPRRRRPGRIPAAGGAYDRAGPSRSTAEAIGARPAPRGDGGRRDQPTRPSSRRCDPSGSSCRRGRSATPGPASRSSPRRACRATRTRRSPTRPRSTASPASRRRVALHIPWDQVDDYADLARHAADARGHASARSTRTSSRTTTTCSAASATRMPRVRRKALDHLLACIDIMDATGSRDLKLWFSDGTNYPGQDDIRARQDRLAEALAAVHARLGPDQRMLLEYKFFEPSFYTMDVPDWGTAYIQCVAAGPEGARSSSTPATTRRAPTSSSSSRRCCAPTGSAGSTSTRASTPTTT